MYSRVPREFTLSFQNLVPVEMPGGEFIPDVRISLFRGQ
jgi:hypothetical protein